MVSERNRRLAVVAAGLIVLGTEAFAAAGAEHPLIAALVVVQISTLAVLDLTS